MGKRPWGSINRWNRPRLIYDPVFQNFKPITFVQCISFFSLSFYFIQAHRYQRRSITADDPQIWVFFMQNSRTGVLYLLWKQKQQQQNRPNIVRYAEHDIICITTIGTTISLHGFQNLGKKCAIFLFNKPSHFIENWW